MLQVTVIPVVAKADTMTDEELATFRKEVCPLFCNVVAVLCDTCIMLP
jgi:septin family protein